MQTASESIYQAHWTGGASWGVAPEYLPLRGDSVSPYLAGVIRSAGNNVLSPGFSLISRISKTLLSGR